MTLYVYTDGASRGNPGESASGYCILDGSKKLVLKEIFYNGVCTNNVAEYRAVIAALKRVLGEWGADTELVLHSDSQVVVRQLGGYYKVREPTLKKLNAEANKLLRKLKNHRILSVKRENRYVSLVDRELNLFLDRKAHGQEKL